MQIDKNEFKILFYFKTDREITDEEIQQIKELSKHCVNYKDHNIYYKLKLNDSYWLKVQHGNYVEFVSEEIPKSCFIAAKHRYGYYYSGEEKQITAVNINQLKMMIDNEAYTNLFNENDVDTKDKIKALKNDMIEFIQKNRLNPDTVKNIGSYGLVDPLKKMCEKEKSDKLLEVRKFLEPMFKKTNSWAAIYIIAKVIESKNNYRIALLRPLDSTRNDVLICKNPQYNGFNYIDEDRLVAISNHNGDIYSFSEVIENLDDLDDLVVMFTKYIKMQTQQNIDLLLNFNDLATKNQQIMLELKKQERAEKLVLLKNKQYEAAIKTMDKKPFIKNHISFMGNKAVYEDIVLELPKEYFTFAGYFKGQSVDNVEDFNRIFSWAIEHIVAGWLYGSDRWEFRRALSRQTDYWECLKRDKYKDDSYNREYRNCKIFGADEFDINVDSKQLKLTKKNNRYLINGIRINKHELAEVLKYAMCYPTEEDYKKFLEVVSKCSLKFQKAITRNIRVGLRGSLGTKRDRDSGEYYDIQLKLTREKNRNYIVVGEGKYPISDTNKLIDSNGGDMIAYAGMLMDITGMPLTSVKELLGECHERYLAAVKKSKELLERTKKMFNVELKTVNGRTGLVLKGNSGNEYLIENNSYDDHTNYPIYQIRGTDMEHRCIVDKTLVNQVGEDALVSRIYALANDTYVAKDITTLKV